MEISFFDMTEEINVLEILWTPLSETNSDVPTSILKDGVKDI